MERRCNNTILVVSVWAVVVAKLTEQSFPMQEVCVGTSVTRGLFKNIKFSHSIAWNWAQLHKISQRVISFKNIPSGTISPDQVTLFETSKSFKVKQTFNKLLKIYDPYYYFQTLNLSTKRSSWQVSKWLTTNFFV